MQNFNENVPETTFRHNEKQDIKIEVNSDEGKVYNFIVNADDFGISAPRSQGIMELIKQQRVSSVSVLVTGVNGNSVINSSKQLNQYVFQKGKQLMQSKHENGIHHGTYSGLMKSVSVGLHFNLTEGPCLSTIMPCDLINSQTNSFKGKLFIYQYMDMLKSTNSSFPLTVKELIKSQLRLQIQKFIELFHFRPSHIDGHNHVHCIPEVAEIIGPIMQQYGVYKTRVPEQQLRESNPKSELFVNNAKLSKPIFDKYKIIYPSNFIGCEQINKLDFTSINDKISNIIKEPIQHKNRFIQLMCHPGYSDPGNGDQFNQSENREVQMKSLKSQLFTHSFLSTSKKVTLSNYNYLQPPVNSDHKKRILLYSKMNNGCGNWTTSLRLQQIFESLGYEVYLRSIQQSINTHYQIESLRQFIIHFQISLVIGVNLTRSGRVIYHATRSQNQITNRVPYFFIVAGTDANIYFDKPEAVQFLKQPIQHCELLISLSDSMVKLTQNFLKEKLHFKSDQKQIILLSQSSNILAFEQQDPEALKSVYECLKLNYKLSPKQDKYIVFPASFRPVKDLQFLLKEFNQLIDRQQGLRVLILGPLLDEKYYNKCLTQMGKVEYFGSLEKELYVQVLKNALFLVNTSISEGQSCSIQQAQQCRQLCVVRNNEGNAELVKHLQTGFLFNTSQEFLKLYDLIKKNQNNLIDTLKKNGLEHHKEKFSVNAEKNSYKRIFESILPQQGKLFTYSDVHALSEINISMYKAVPQHILQKWFNCGDKSKRLIDIGCGSGIFSFVIFSKFNIQMQEQILLQLYDYNASVISNCYYNCLQQLGGQLKHVKSIELKVSDMFSEVNNCKQQPNLYVANMPQTPFRFDKSRPDKNGGHDSFKFNQQLITKFATFHEDSVLIMLYSYMSHPSKFFNLIKSLDLEIVWRSQKYYFNISSYQYDLMEENLSDFIKQHINEGRAEVEIVQKQGEEIFIVPAQILILQKKKQTKTENL